MINTCKACNCSNPIDATVGNWGAAYIGIGYAHELVRPSELFVCSLTHAMLCVARFPVASTGCKEEYRSPSTDFEFKYVTIEREELLY